MIFLIANVLPSRVFYPALAAALALLVVITLEAARAWRLRQADRRTVDANADEPLLRGVIHEVMFVVAAAAAVLTQLLTWSGPPRLRIIAIAFGIASVLLYGISAVFHRWPWQARGRSIMQRVDHCWIFVFSSALAALVVPDTRLGRVVLVAVGMLAIVGIVVRLRRREATRLSYGLYVPVGWLPIFAIGDLIREVGWTPGVLVMAGGVVYQLGGLVFYLGRHRLESVLLNPSRKWFAHQELFHAATAVGWALLLIAAWRWILPPPAGL